MVERGSLLAPFRGATQRWPWAPADPTPATRELHELPRHAPGVQLPVKPALPSGGEVEVGLLLCREVDALQHGPGHEGIMAAPPTLPLAFAGALPDVLANLAEGPWASLGGVLRNPWV